MLNYNLERLEKSLQSGMDIRNHFAEGYELPNESSVNRKLIPAVLSVIDKHRDRWGDNFSLYVYGSATHGLSDNKPDLHDIAVVDTVMDEIFKEDDEIWQREAINQFKKEAPELGVNGADFRYFHKGSLKQYEFPFWSVTIKTAGVHVFGPDIRDDLYIPETRGELARIFQGRRTKGLRGGLFKEGRQYFAKHLIRILSIYSLLSIGRYSDIPERQVGIVKTISSPEYQDELNVLLQTTEEGKIFHNKVPDRQFAEFVIRKSAELDALLRE